MTDMENKDLPQEEQAEQPREPVEDGFSQPPAPESPEESEPVPPETAEPVYPEAPPPQGGEQAPAEEAPPIWQDVSSGVPAGVQGGEPPVQQPLPSPPWQGYPQPGSTPLQQEGAMPPPVWPGQPGYAPPYPSQPVPPQAPWQGQPGYMNQQGANAQQPYYGGYAGYYGGIPPQAGAAAPPYYGGYPAAAPYAPYPAPEQQSPPPKKKKPLALKVFLWILSILVAGTLVGFGIYLAAELQSPDRAPLLPEEYMEPDPLPPESQPEESLPPAEDEEIEDLPDVDVTPNREGISLEPKPQGETLEPEAVYDKMVKSTVAISATLTRQGQTSESKGTGIIATADGYMITNAHVVLNSKSARVTVQTYDGQEYDAVVVGVDRTTDLAVIKTNDHNFTPAVFGDTEELSMGEWVMALGNPGGTKYANSLTRGIVSGLHREAGQYSANGMTYIQTDAAINPGNSGGPLVNMYGQVVGINSSKIVTENYEGMGFAIPISEARPIINELLSGGYIKGRTRLGIMIREIDSGTSAMLGVPAGLAITEINEDSAFTGTKAQAGDIITALDDEPVSSLRDVSNLLLRYAPGDEVTVTLYRPAPENGGTSSEFTVTITLLEDKGETQE